MAFSRRPTSRLRAIANASTSHRRHPRASNPDRQRSRRAVLPSERAELVALDVFTRAQDAGQPFTNFSSGRPADQLEPNRQPRPRHDQQYCQRLEAFVPEKGPNGTTGSGSLVTGLLCTQAPLIGADLRLRSIKWLTTA